MDAYARTRVGQDVGKYTLERLLGVGGMAAVYEAVHRKNGNRVAVKMLHPHVAMIGDLRERFLREGYLANRVGHRGAVKVIDDDVAADSSVFLVMELLSGTTVDALWVRHRERLPVSEGCELIRQLLDVLVMAHDKGIVHRDLKPENLFVTDEGMLKVLDFGIARLLENTGKARTATGRMMGTPAFMPPEQALGRTRDIDGQTDIWSVGATLFTLLSGKFVHHAETVEEMLVWAGSRPARSLAEVSPLTPPPIVAVVDRALAFEKSKRWASARAMKGALDEAYVTISGAPSSAAARDVVNRAALAATVNAALAQAPVAPTVDDPSLVSPSRIPPTMEMTGDHATAKRHAWARGRWCGIACRARSCARRR